MKALKIIALIVACVMSLTIFSCKKEDTQKRDFYLEQSRADDLVGVYHLLDNDTSVSSTIVWDIRSNGAIFSYTIRDANEYGSKFPKSYWYTKENKLHTLFYPNDWDKGSSEDLAYYWFSDAKDTLFLNFGYDNGTSVFIRQ